MRPERQLARGSGARPSKRARARASTTRSRARRDALAAACARVHNASGAQRRVALEAAAEPAAAASSTAWPSPTHAGSPPSSTDARSWPKARRHHQSRGARENPFAVVRDDVVVARHAQRRHRVGEEARRRQHVRQVRRVVRRVQIPVPRARDPPRRVLGLAVAAHRRQVPRGVDDLDGGQPRRQPRGRDEGRDAARHFCAAGRGHAEIDRAGASVARRSLPPLLLPAPAVLHSASLHTADRVHTAQASAHTAEFSRCSPPTRTARRAPQAESSWRCGRRSSSTTSSGTRTSRRRRRSSPASPSTRSSSSTSPRRWSRRSPTAASTGCRRRTTSRRR